MNAHELIANHIGWIESMARRLCRDRAEASDLAGETIIKCLNQSEGFDVSREFKPWALTILTNTFRTLYNRKKCVPFSGYDLCDNFISPHRSDEMAMYNEVTDAICQLHNKSVCIQCVLLYIEGFTYAEIGQLLGIGVGTVKSRMREARRMLRARLGRFLSY